MYMAAKVTEKARVAEEATLAAEAAREAEEDSKAEALVEYWLENLFDTKAAERNRKETEIMEVAVTVAASSADADPLAVASTATRQEGVKSEGLVTRQPAHTSVAAHEAPKDSPLIHPVHHPSDPEPVDEVAKLHRPCLGTRARVRLMALSPAPSLPCPPHSCAPSVTRLPPPAPHLAMSPSYFLPSLAALPFPLASRRFTISLRPTAAACPSLKLPGHPHRGHLPPGCRPPALRWRLPSQTNLPQATLPD